MVYNPRWLYKMMDKRAGVAQPSLAASPFCLDSHTENPVGGGMKKSNNTMPELSAIAHTETI